jgi:hypothetical protein
MCRSGECEEGLKSLNVGKSVANNMLPKGPACGESEATARYAR